MAKECLLPFKYRYRSRDLSFVLGHYYLLFTKSNDAASQRTSQRGVTRCASLSVSQNRSWSFLPARRLWLKSPGPSTTPSGPATPTPRPLLPTPSVRLPAARVHVFLSAVSALCCTNRGRLPKVHATRPRLIIILRRIVDPERPGRAQENKASIRNSADCAAGKMVGAYYGTCDNKWTRVEFCLSASRMISSWILISWIRSNLILIARKKAERILNYWKFKEI